MEHQYFHEFVVLAQTGNYMKAADLLFITQPTMSRHIQSIEKELGVSLFHRNTRNLELSEYGKLFLPYAQQIASLTHDCITEIDNYKRSNPGAVTIGTLPMMAPYNITHILSQFQQQTPGVELKIIQEDDVSLLRQNICDFIFIRETHVHYDDLELLPFTSDNLAAIFPNDHPFAQEKSVFLRQLEHENFLLLGKHTQMYDLCVTECRKVGFEPKIVFSGKRAEDIISLICDHIGIGLLTKKPILFLNNANVTAVDIEPIIETKISLAYIKERRQSSAAMAFLAFVHGYVNQ